MTEADLWRVVRGVAAQLESALPQYSTVEVAGGVHFSIGAIMRADGLGFTITVHVPAFAIADDADRTRKG